MGNRLPAWESGDLPRTRHRVHLLRFVEVRGSLMSADVDDIVERLGPRAVIGQAVDVLMTRDGVSRDDAFEMLVQRSSSSHRKVRETAAEVVQHDGD